MWLYVEDKKIMKVDVADTFFRRMRGLMLRKKIQKGLLIKPCNSIHTFFMKCNIDVLYVNKKGRIIRMICDLKPWRFGPLLFRSYAVIELPAGTINKTDIQPGKTVYFKSS